MTAPTQPEIHRMPAARKFLRSTVVALLAVVAGTLPVGAQTPPGERPDLQSLFDAAGTTGTIVVKRLRDGVTVVVNPARASTGYTPASTFKILNSLLVLEAGLVSDVDKGVFRYAGQPFLVEGKPFLPEVCNADITLRTAFKFSCIPVYQELARRLGPARYTDAIRALGYGNGVIDRAPADAFWLEGDYRVTALQQVAFLERLARGTLPFAKTTQDAVRDIMFVEQVPGGTLRGKTGYLYSTKPAIGWFVGWLEAGQDITLFALNLDIRTADHARARMTIARQVLDAVR